MSSRKIAREFYQQRGVRGLSASLILLVWIVVGCSSPATPPVLVHATPRSLPAIPTITITALDYAYSMPANLDIQAGLVSFALVNNGSQPHQAQVARLNSGVTDGQVVDQLITKKNQNAAFSLLSFEGGPDVVAAGYGQEVTLNLTTGQYVLLCLVVGSDGIPHVDKGMIHFFNVSSSSSHLAPPQDAGVVMMKNFSFSLPTSISHARTQTLLVTNGDSEPHELSIVRLAAHKTASDVRAFYQAPAGAPPFVEVGGMAALDAGASAWLSLSLDPGNYVVYSYMPDIKTGQSQLFLGMIASFTVS